MQAKLENEIKVFELLAKNNEFFKVEMDSGMLKIEDKRTKNIIEVDPWDIKEFYYLAPNTVMIKKWINRHVTIGLLTGYLYVSC